MFSTRESLKRRTPKIGINRENYIKLLVDEYYDKNSDIEAKEQVTANLANFAYDPINYEYLKKAEAFELFLELLGNVNPVLVTHGITGLCNFCLDPEVNTQLKDISKLKYVLDLLKSDVDPNIACNCLTILFYLQFPDLKKILVERNLFHLLQEFKSSSSDARLRNISTILLQDLTKELNSASLRNIRLLGASTSPFSTAAFKAGDVVRTTRVITQRDLDRFSDISGDHNPIHKGGQPKPAIVHGAFLNSIISGIIGTQLPGPGTEVISQTFFFPNKCYPDKEIQIEVELKDTRKIMKVGYKCVQDGKVVFDGEARVIYNDSN
ncbi:LOW QUALITY PROTEIN: armadillo repeat-containing protein 7 [Culicoides brevitarsis]|uniref:LOW QUALITY PROTEIN: armadillo repeat-containing protein 7 n=1 Tax=Culicoides brevitarsis TaxID=469753 RepID=UPI00307C2044